ncbi:MAG: hypothetical protein AW10_01140 [Candidatus Accumulibacter appositus]|uniref:Uncharacterized protein n=1 Tax=Candidatus Accumulibacter appositus TaxID=1454003 RepID=A0A011NFZ3_9PROT|nr:MAG: hypothetical protein AW10_01140 [Candidatus Accumulibacter appositus]
MREHRDAVASNAGGEIGDGVHRSVVGDIEEITEGIAGEGDDELVSAGATGQGVVAQTTFQGVVADAANQDVASVAAIEFIVAAATIERIVTASAQDYVVAGKASQGVIACGPVDPVVTCAANQRIRAGRSDGRIKVIAKVPGTEIGLGDIVQNPYRLECCSAPRTVTVELDQRARA